MWEISGLEEGEYQGVPVHKRDANEAYSNEGVWWSLPTRPGHFEHVGSLWLANMCWHSDLCFLIDA